MDQAGTWSIRLLVVLLALIASAGCSGGQAPQADKAGGQSPPVELRLAVADASDQQPSAAEINDFARRVGELSHGTVHISITWSAAGEAVPGLEGRVADMVQRRRYDLGWIGARAWDERGIDSFRALQAPFLITDTQLLEEVAVGSVGRQMLNGLRPHGLVGLALVPDLPRHPVGLRRPLVSLADFTGAKIRDLPSRATDSLLTALGATPVHISAQAIGLAVTRREIDGEEGSLVGPPAGSYVTANIAFFDKALTLFANAASLASLSDDQREAINTAAREMTGRAPASIPSENDLIGKFCSEGQIVVARDRAVKAIVRASRPVYAAFEQNAQTRRFIAAIRRLKEA